MVRGHAPHASRGGRGLDHSFESWLTQSLAAQIDFAASRPIMERHELNKGEVLFQQGEPPDPVEIQASGCVAITITDEHGRPIRLGA